MGPGEVVHALTNPPVRRRCDHGIDRVGPSCERAGKRRGVGEADQTQNQSLVFRRPQRIRADLRARSGPEGGLRAG